MTRDPATIEPTASLRDAVKMLDDLNVGVLPVCDGVSLIGMLTDREIVVRAVSAGIAPTERIEGVVSGPPKWCYVDDSVDNVRKMMESARVDAWSGLRAIPSRSLIRDHVLRSDCREHAGAAPVEPT